MCVLAKLTLPAQGGPAELGLGPRALGSADSPPPSRPRGPPSASAQAAEVPSNEQ